MANLDRAGTEIESAQEIIKNNEDGFENINNRLKKLNKQVSKLDELIRKKKIQKAGSGKRKKRLKSVTAGLDKETASNNLLSIKYDTSENYPDQFYYALGTSKIRFERGIFNPFKDYFKHLAFERKYKAADISPRSPMGFFYHYLDRDDSFFPLDIIVCKLFEGAKCYVYSTKKYSYNIITKIPKYPQIDRAILTHPVYKLPNDNLLGKLRGNLDDYFKVGINPAKINLNIIFKNTSKRNIFSLYIPMTSKDPRLQYWKKSVSKKIKSLMDCAIGHVFVIHNKKESFNMYYRDGYMSERTFESGLKTAITLFGAIP